MGQFRSGAPQPPAKLYFAPARPPAHAQQVWRRRRSRDYDLTGGMFERASRYKYRDPDSRIQGRGNAVQNNPFSVATGANRRGVLTGACATGAALAFSSRVGAQPAAGAALKVGPVVETSNGKVRGYIAGNVHTFRGLRYGASTAGANRFKPPVAPEPWTGVMEGYIASGGPTAPQLSRVPGPPLTGAWVGEAAMSEDCLTVNVFTPGVNDQAKRPVMVWLHGGQWLYGAGSEPISDGTRLAGRNDVVVVTVNHRINLFGYMYLTEALGPDYADSSNLGVLDCIAALRWVRDNIARFGGDPANVTLFGWSSGGSEISQLASMPSAEGLFHKIIVQSGALLKLRTPAVAAAATDRVLTRLGLTRATARQLLTLPMGAIAKVADSGAAPTVDGRSTPRQPWNPDAPPAMKRIPMIIGGTDSELAYGADEAALNLDRDTLRRRVANLGEYGEAVLAAFSEGRPNATPAELSFYIQTGLWTTKRVIQQAERTVSLGGAPTYVYRWEWRLPSRYLSAHGSDLPFVWDNIAVVPEMIGTGPALQRLADRVSRRWVAFARTGDPNIAGQPRWPAYDIARRATLVIDREDRIVEDPRRAERLALMQLPDALSENVRAFR
jgi:para-nitrobenzyl esterase